MKKFASWGFTNLEAIVQAREWQCYHCGDLWDQGLGSNNIVGFRDDSFSLNSLHYAGEVVILCPGCGRKYWFHAPSGWLMRVAESCTNWP